MKIEPNHQETTYKFKKKGGKTLAKISQKTKTVLLELGIELLKTLKELNDKDKLKSPRKTKPKKGAKPNADTTNNN